MATLCLRQQGGLGIYGDSIDSELNAFTQREDKRRLNIRARTFEQLW